MSNLRLSLLKFIFLQPKAIAPELTIIIFLFFNFNFCISFAKLCSHFFLIFFLSSIINEDPILINVNATFSGSYTLNVTDANGCAAFAKTIEIDVRDGIDEPIITSNAPVCVGEIITLETQVYTGIGLNYEWTKDGQVLPTTQLSHLYHRGRQILSL